MIDEIKSFIETCPLLSGDSINVNYLGNERKTYSIETSPTSPIVKEYADGGKLCQQLFVFASRELYSASTEKNTEVTRFYEDFSAWIQEQNKQRNLPKLSSSCVAQSIEVLTEQYLDDVGNTDARYQIQCRLVYYKDF